MRDTFPVLFMYQSDNFYRGCPKTIPLVVLNDEWAIHIHGENLQYLAKRGGLSPREIVLNIERLELSQLTKISDRHAMKLIHELNSYE